MTNNQLTREENVQAVFDLKAGYKLYCTHFVGR